MMTTKTDFQHFDLLIDGKITNPHGRYFDSINPSTGEVCVRLAEARVEDVEQAIRSARIAFDNGGWSGLSIHERGQYLIKIAHKVREHAKELAQLECEDTGKTIKQATFIDVPTCADTFEYFGKVSSQLQGTINPVPAPVKSLTEREPMGVVGCIIPWNYPLIMAAWKIAPALIAGNCVVLKPSRYGSAAIMKLAQLIQKLDLPAGVLNVVTTTHHEATKELARNSHVDLISFTGGTETGQDIMRLASSTTKKLSLELGGKSPNIVFADCDMEAAIGGTMSAIFMNQGQMCTAGSRLLVEDKIYDDFVGRLIEKTKKLKIGPAMSYETDFGPLVSKEHRDQVLAKIASGLAEGAKLLCGGKVPENIQSGYYLEPTILSVKNSMTIAQEEIFGPVLCVLKFTDFANAVELANDTRYGLAACVWTKDLNKAHDIARRLKCGTVWINTYGGFYNEASFGGYKQSGFGRELGLDGLLEYTQSKHICIDQTPGGRSLVTSWF